MIEDLYKKIEQYKVVLKSSFNKKEIEIPLTYDELVFIHQLVETAYFLVILCKGNSK